MRTHTLGYAAALGGILGVAALAGGCDSGTTGTEPTGRPPQAATSPTSAAPGAASADASVKSATATIEPSKAEGQDNIAGTVTFTPAGDGLRVHAAITGLTPNGEHGFHIHEKGDLSAPDLASAGSHFNPGGHKHGGPAGTERHGGDLGNLKADASGKATYDVTIEGITIDDPKTGVVGKSVIIHEKADDLKSDPSGNSGARIGGGVIKAGGGGAGQAR